MGSASAGGTCLDASGTSRSRGSGGPGRRLGASCCRAFRSGRRLGAPGDAAGAGRPIQPGSEHAARACGATDRGARSCGAGALGGSGPRPRSHRLGIAAGKRAA